MEADIVGFSGEGDYWLADTAAYPMNAMNSDVYFPPTAATIAREGDVHEISAVLNADSSWVTIYLVDDAVADNRDGLMRRPTHHVNPEMPYPTWHESSYNSDICFDHWPDWQALFARTQDDAAHVAALLSEAASGAEVFEGGGGGAGGAGDGGCWGVIYGFDGSENDGGIVMMSSPSSGGMARESEKVM